MSNKNFKNFVSAETRHNPGTYTYFLSNFEFSNFRKMFDVQNNNANYYLLILIWSKSMSRKGP